MSKTFSVANAMIYDTDKEEFLCGGIAVEDGVITEIGELSEQKRRDAVDANKRRVIPAMVDVHTHGRAGTDFCGADADAMRRLKYEYAKSGTATVVPTLASDTFETWLSTTDAANNTGFDAIHYEGRYLAPKKRGAHAPEFLADPAPEELCALAERASGMKMHVSFAAELPGGIEFIKLARSLGATVGLAHTDAGYDEAMAAVAAGLTSFTHTFNAMTGLSHRAPGVVCAALTSGLYAEFICDGIHIHPAVIDLAYRVVPHDRFVLITDSLMAAGCGDGRYTLAGLGVTVKDGVARTDDGAIAGSMLDLYTAMRNLMSFTGIPLEKALPCATVNPARMLGLDGITGALRPGLRADICILGEDGISLGDVYAAGEKIV